MNRIRQLIGLKGFTFKMSSKNSFVAVSGENIISCEQNYKGYTVVTVLNGSTTIFTDSKSMKVIQFLKSQLKGV